jgi:ribonuclease HII
MPNFAYENRCGRKEGKIICGVDEVGRGPLAGPVVATAVILPHAFPQSLCRDIHDSKKMSAKARDAICSALISHCWHATAEASVGEIDKLNILWASMLAMERAVAALIHKILDVTTVPEPPPLPEIHMALIDGNRAPKIACQAFPIIAGDDKSLSIAAASIIAKVHRDRLMKQLALEFPFYGWERNAGYGTSQHLEALNQHGLTTWHRTSFAPVRRARAQVI